ncbi:hypothetical protein ACFUCH_09210 [Streptomyces olivaceus]|uniref:hypothetical protein n=1 Tax=Streptomyces olivaceus TaxID=47716 RepID=UPI00362BE4D5
MRSLVLPVIAQGGGLPAGRLPETLASVTALFSGAWPRAAPPVPFRTWAAGRCPG